MGSIPDGSSVEMLTANDESGWHCRWMNRSALLHGRCSARGQVYAITTVTHARERLFEDVGNVGIVIDALRYVEHYQRSRTLAWVVMPDHLHWLVQLRTGNLAQCVRCLKLRSAQRINRSARRTGHVWQAGHYDHAVRREDSLHRQARYILENPVRAGLARAVGEYPYAWCRWAMDPNGR